MQLLVRALCLRVAYSLSDRFEKALAGLESLAMGWTTMLTHRVHGLLLRILAGGQKHVLSMERPCKDCTDLRWEMWRWLSYQCPELQLQSYPMDLRLVFACCVTWAT